METQIRRYQNQDLTAIMHVWEKANELAHSFLSGDFVDTVREAIPTLFIPQAEVWVADINGRVVGFMALLGNEVGAIFVDPDLHRNGIGSRLIDKALSIHEALYLEVFVNNVVGRQFYSKYGFSATEEKYHEPSGERVLVMMKRAEERKDQLGAFE